MANQYYKSFEELPVMLTIPQVASVLSISRAGAYELAHSKNFPSMLIGSRIVVPKDRLLAWVDSKEHGEREVSENVKTEDGRPLYSRPG